MGSNWQSERGLLVKTSVLMNSRYEGIPLYLCLLVFNNECRDDVYREHPTAFMTAKQMVITMNTMTNDSYRAYIFTEDELIVGIRAIEYAAGRGFVLVSRKKLDRLAAKLRRKLKRLQAANSLT